MQGFTVLPRDQNIAILATAELASYDPTYLLLRDTALAKREAVFSATRSLALSGGLYDRFERVNNNDYPMSLANDCLLTFEIDQDPADFEA